MTDLVTALLLNRQLCLYPTTSVVVLVVGNDEHPLVLVAQDHSPDGLSLYSVTTTNDFTTNDPIFVSLALRRLLK